MFKYPIISRIKKLKAGVKLLLLVLSISISMIGVLIIAEWHFYWIFDEFDEFLFLFMSMFLGFWVVVRIALWIIDGFYLSNIKK